MKLNFKTYFFETMDDYPKYRILKIFDFDDTLFFSPNREKGSEIWQNHMGIPYPHKGWWGRKETLDPPIVSHPPPNEMLNDKIAYEFMKAKEDPNTYVVMMTGRHAGMANQVNRILSHFGLHADEEFYQGDKKLTNHPNYPKKGGGSEHGNTISYKKHVISDRLVHPNLETIEIWEDREEHVQEFVNLGKSLKEHYPSLKKYVVHDVKKNIDHEI